MPSKAWLPHLGDAAERHPAFVVRCIGRDSELDTLNVPDVLADVIMESAA
jgi:hypothetical protein